MSGIGESGRGLRIPVAHRAPVRGLAGTARGPGLIVSAGGDGTIRSWDTGSGVAGDFVVACGPSPVSFVGVVEAAGVALVICADSTAVRRFDLSSGQEVGEPLRAPGTEWVPFGGMGPVATFCDGEVSLLVAAGIDGKVHRWDAVTGELVGESWAGGDDKLHAIAVLRSSGDRLQIVSSGADSAVRRWDAVTGEAIGAPLPGNRNPVTALACAWGVDGRDLLFGQEYQGPIHRWDVATGELLGEPLPQRGQGMSAGGLAVTPDGRVLLSLDADGTPWRWDLNLAEPVAEPLSVLATLVNAVATVVTPQGPLFVTGSEKGHLQRWDASGSPVGDVLAGHPTSVQEISAVPVSPYSRGLAVLVSSGRDGARCWDAATGDPIGNPPFEPVPVGDGPAAVWMPDGGLMVGSGTSEGILRCEVFSGTIADESSAMPEDEEPPDDPTVWDVAAGRLPDGRPFFAGACADGGVHLVDAESGEPVRGPLQGLPSQVLAVAVTTLADGTVMVAAGGESRRILRWNAVTGEPIGGPLTGPKRWVMRLAFRALPDGRTLLLAVDDDGMVHRWEAMSGDPVGEPLRSTGEAGDAPRLAAVAPGHLIAMGRGGVVRCWDGRTGEPLGDTPDAGSATTVITADGVTLFAIGHTDGSITITPLPQITDGPDQPG
jgi:WD40 repeat protein